MRPSRKGASALEFALCLPVVITLLTGILDWGSYLSAMHEAQSAAREGARLGAATRQDEDPVGRAEARAAARLLEVGITGAGVATLSGLSPDQVITVDVSAVYTPYVGLVPVPATVNGGMTMRMEDQP
jgi:Flp pilus assembly protein TadG